MIKKSLSILSLFGSSATLICCALPFLLVSVGAGAVVAGMAANIPGLVWMSEHKQSLFIIAGIILVLNFIILKKNQAQCPVDLKENCEDTKGMAQIIFYLSLGIYCVGFLFAFILPHILN